MPMYTVFREGAPKKNQFFVKNFPKSAIKQLFWPFFYFACNEKNLEKTGSFYCLRRTQKINFVDLKNVNKNLENFFKIAPPPLEKS